MKKAKKSTSYFAAEEIVGKSIKNPTKNIQGKAYYEKITETAHAIFSELVFCIKNGFKPDSDEVQQIIKKHYTFIEQTHAATQEMYKALAQLYQEHPEFRKQLDPFHPQLAEFMAQAMKIFADKKALYGDR